MGFRRELAAGRLVKSGVYCDADFPAARSFLPLLALPLPGGAAAPVQLLEQGAERGQGQQQRTEVDKQLRGPRYVPQGSPGRLRHTVISLVRGFTNVEDSTNKLGR